MSPAQPHNFARPPWYQGNGAIVVVTANIGNIRAHVRALRSLRFARPATAPAPEAGKADTSPRRPAPRGRRIDVGQVSVNRCHHSLSLTRAAIAGGIHRRPPPAGRMPPALHCAAGE